jgi:hypothetical protein
VQRNLVSGFDDSFRRHLAIEQRRAVLDTIARELNPDTTLGDIVDAAQELGWSENLGELCLADLAVALVGEGDPEPVTTSPAVDTREDDDAETDAEDDDETDADEDETDEDDEEDADADDDEEEEEEDEDDEEEEEAEEEEKPRRGRKVAEAAPNRKPSSMDRALDRIDRALAARGRKPAARAAAEAKPAKGKKGAKKSAKKAASRAADDDTEAMSLDQAAKLLIPLVRKLKEATMQDLEEQTGMGRRKLRFHIGQLVKHGRLKRHGMGRGTCYTVK